MTGATAKTIEVDDDHLARLGLPAETERQIRDSFMQLFAAMLQQQQSPKPPLLETSNNAEDLRRCLVRAQHLASGLNHPQASIEHLLAVLAVDEDGRRELKTRLKPKEYEATALRKASLDVVYEIPPSVSKDVSVNRELASDLQALLIQAQLLARRLRISDHHAANLGDVIEVIFTSAEFVQKRNLFEGATPPTILDVMRDEASGVKKSITSAMEAPSFEALLNLPITISENDAEMRSILGQIIGAIGPSQITVSPPQVTVEQNGWPTAALVVGVISAYGVGILTIMLSRLWW